MTKSKLALLPTFAIKKSKKVNYLLTSITLIICILSVLSFCQFSVKADGSAFGVLRSGAGARALGMGGAYVAVADTFSAGYWNPAGITRNGSINIGGMYLDKYGLYNINFLSAGVSLSDNGDSGSNWFNSHFRDLSFSGTYSGFSTPLSKNSNYSERLFKGVFGFTVTNLGSIGGSVKNYRLRAPKTGVDGKDVTANGFGFDLGLLTEPIEGLRLGAAGFDLPDGTEIKWFNTPTHNVDAVPARYSIGAAYTFDFNEPTMPNWISGSSILSGQYTFCPDCAGLKTWHDKEKIRMGLEYNVSNNLSSLSARAGAIKPLGGKICLTAGAGLEIYGLSADVAWVQNNVLEAENALDTIVLSSEFTF